MSYRRKIVIGKSTGRKENTRKKIYDFRIEYREQHKGLAVEIPRFSWKIASGDNNVVQTAWRLIVNSAGKRFWDSGKVESDQSVLIPYAGQALAREQEYQVSL